MIDERTNAKGLLNQWVCSGQHSQDAQRKFQKQSFILLDLHRSIADEAPQIPQSNNKHCRLGLCRCPEQLASLPRLSIVTERRRTAVHVHHIFFTARSSTLKNLTYKSSIESPVLCCMPSSGSFPEEPLPTRESPLSPCFLPQASEPYAQH